MILPDKYLTVSESLLGISGLILDLISNRCISIEDIWFQFEKKYINTNKLKKKPDYQKFLYSIDFMYLCGMIDYNDSGEIYNENIKSEN